MPPKIKVDKKDVLSAALSITRERGIKDINARSLAARLNCSTNPIFRIYDNMEELKNDLIDEIYKYYREFTNKYTFDDELFRTSYAYIEFARHERHLFETIYISDVGGRRTLSEILQSTYNQQIISKMQKQYSISEDKAQQIFRDVRFYSHGIAAQVLVDSILISEEEVKELLKIAIQKFKSND